MAKEWGMFPSDRALEQKKRYSDRVNSEIYKETNKKSSIPKPGIKSTVIQVYVEKGKLEAWKVLQGFNKKLSGEGFTLEMLEQWIVEYEKRQNRGVGKDNGSGR